ncbi:MAG TPA: Rieske 2Fe-2S domain-containing protein [Longimicrobiales bacterium]|nr:Rieske 2Fe-2S domain-containing protein [Longimicrobiales bacterium]
MHDIEEAHEACEGCELGRRAFIRNSVVAAFGLIGVNWIDAAARTGETVSYAIPAADGAQIDKTNEVILVRWHDEAYAFALSCPHRKTSLRWEPENTRFQCPKHHSKYQPDGSFISGKATRHMDRYPIRLQGNALVVDTTEKIKSDVNGAAWQSAVVKIA